MQVIFLVFVVYYVNLIVYASGSVHKRSNTHVCIHRLQCPYSRYEVMIPVNVYNIKNLKNSEVYKKLLKSRVIQTLHPESQTVPSLEEIDKYVYDVHKSTGNGGTKVIEPMDLISVLKHYHQGSSNQEDEFIKSKTREIIAAQTKSEAESQAAYDNAIAETLFGPTAAAMEFKKQYYSHELPILRDQSFHNPVHVKQNVYTTEDFRALFHDIQSVKNKFIYSDLGRHRPHKDIQVQGQDETLEDSVQPKNERVTEKHYANDKSDDQYNINDLETDQTSDKPFRSDALKNSRRNFNKFSSEMLTRVTRTTEKAAPLFQEDSDFEDVTLQGAFTYDMTKMTVTEVTSSYPETDNVESNIYKFKKQSKNDEKYHVRNYKNTTNPDDGPVKIKMTTHWDLNKVTPVSNHFGLDFNDLVGPHNIEDHSEVNKQFRKNGSIDFDLLRKLINEKKKESEKKLPKKQDDQKSRKSFVITTQRTDKYDNTRPTICLHFANIIPRRDKKHKSKIPERRPIEDEFNKIRAMNYKNKMERHNSHEHTMRKQYNLHRRNPVENNAYEVKVQSPNPSPTYYNGEELANERTVKKLFHTEADTTFLKDIFFKHYNSDEVSNSDSRQERNELAFRPRRPM